MNHAVARAFAPASVGNVAVGFDILGHSIEGPGDYVTVRCIDEQVVRIARIDGVAANLPLDAARNTAGAALAAMRRELRIAHGFEIEIDKGIPLASGMGGSAASAVAALVAANALLAEPLPRESLYPFSLEGEAVASGGLHGDNLGPMLIGGLVLATADRLVPIPVPEGLCCALVHPHAELETRAARAALTAPYPLADFVAQSANLASVLAGCYRGDIDLIKAGLADQLVEPRRAPLIAGFAEVKQAALDGGAIGASISGAGPSVFAWCQDQTSAEAVAEAMAHAFKHAGFASDRWVSPVAGPAARLVSCAA